MAVELPGARRVAFGIVLGQASLTALIAAVCALLWGWPAGYSAALGGGIGAAASLALALIAFRGGGRQSPERAARSFYLGEAAKVVVVIASFAVVLATLKVVPAALFGAYVATFFVYWAALARALPG